MGSSLFSWATDLQDLCSTSDYSQFFDHYFMQTDVLLYVFLIGAGIAAAVAAIFYFGICNTSYTLSTRINWFVALVISCAATFFVSDFYLKGHDGGEASASSGLFLDSYNLQDDIAVTLEDSDEQLAQWNADSEDFRQALNTGDFDIITNISLINTLYAFLIFILLSFVFKGLTIHGKNLPV